MNIEPGHIDQIRRGSHGRMVQIDRDVGGVAEDLRQIDPCLKVRFAENANPPVWVVYWEDPDGRSTYLVTSCQAYQTASGVWTGLDQRLVRRIQQIDPRNGYDYAAELEAHNRKVDADRKARFRERVGETAEVAAHATRKDLGVRYKGRAFVPRGL